MSSFVELMSEIRRRPGMYIGKRSAIRLQLFIQGWSLGRKDIKDLELLSGFQEWVAARYHIETGHSWADIVTFFSEDGVEAFERTLEHFDEYLDSVSFAGS